MRPSNPVRIFLDEPHWDIRRHNTDGRYVTHMLPQLAHFEPQLHFIQPHSTLSALRENARILRFALQRRLHNPPSFEQQVTARLSRRELNTSHARAVFSHRAFPTNAGPTPVIWQQSILDPAMQLSYGATETEMATELRVKGDLYHRCAFIQLSTEAEVARLSTLFPDIASRFAAVPFFTPHTTACDPEDLTRHLTDTTTRILFVGRQAWRKGLDLLLAAYTALPTSLQQRTELTIISDLQQSAINIPTHDRIRVIPTATPAEVLAEMRRAHILVNVARFESYGLIFHEAMSQGTVCLAPDWEVQRELFANGTAGVILKPDGSAIQQALEHLITNPTERHSLALAAHTRFRTQYAPEVVAARYARLFAST